MAALVPAIHAGNYGDSLRNFQLEARAVLAPPPVCDDGFVMPRAGRRASQRGAQHAQIAKERFRQRPT
jgi:hypothetical protein